MPNNIVLLIDAYLAAVHEAAEAVKSHLNTSDPLMAVHENLSLRRGMIDSATEYAFHGFGCLVTRGGKSVDFDFGPNGTTGGFDAWRLLMFAREDVVGFKLWQTEESIQTELQRLHDEGMVDLPRTPPSTHLYYLSTAGQAAVDEACRPQTQGSPEKGVQ